MRCWIVVALLGCGGGSPNHEVDAGTIALDAQAEEDATATDAMPDARLVDATTAPEDAAGIDASADAEAPDGPWSDAEPVDAESADADATDGSHLDAPSDTSTLPDATRDASANLVNCRPADVTCNERPPSCDFGMAPSVVDGCYGRCVAVESCPCSEANDCPEPERYTCHRFRSACGPYL